ncbi:unnamed protein product [Ceratitis capitata]|uniref:(Mediterranean fruit fly) hypothetical protein n=1 Tax=Ceratitis capitata TaxID=7213 RepID=A0A811UGF9_CERCA|nr:unnamed protein product [Ceratitis capitata]
MKFVATTKDQLKQLSKKHYSLNYIEAEQEESKRINNLHAVNFGTLNNVSLCGAVKFAKFIVFATANKGLHLKYLKACKQATNNIEEASTTDSSKNSYISLSAHPALQFSSASTVSILTHKKYDGSTTASLCSYKISATSPKSKRKTSNKDKKMPRRNKKGGKVYISLF